jgi:hypothetical protein
MLREFGFRGGKGYGRQDFVFPEDVFAFGVDARQTEELGCWNRAFIRGADDAKRRLQGDQRLTMKLGSPPKMA